MRPLKKNYSKKFERRRKTNKINNKNLYLQFQVAARFCEGGHICSLPRECCTQGCCPPYQTGPRQLPPATDHVLNLFFISHWYFW